jgi:6-hydroxynicotinate reductase
MVDITAMPDDAFGFVPTPAIVGPIEFTMRRADYAAMGGHMDRVRQLVEVQRSQRMRREVLRQPDPWPHPPPALIADPDEGAGG